MTDDDQTPALAGLPMLDLLLAVGAAETGDQLDAIDAELDRRLG